MTVEIHRATAEEIPLLAAMNKQLIEDERHENAMSVDELAERMQEFLAATYHAYVFVHEKNILGYALIDTAYEPAYLRQFFIAREKRRLGLGRKCFSLLLEILDARAINLDVLVWNSTAIGFWKALGFHERSVRMQLGNLPRD